MLRLCVHVVLFALVGRLDSGVVESRPRSIVVLPRRDEVPQSREKHDSSRDDGAVIHICRGDRVQRWHDQDDDFKGGPDDSDPSYEGTASAPEIERTRLVVHLWVIAEEELACDGDSVRGVQRHCTEREDGCNADC